MQRGVVAKFISGSGLKRVFGGGCPRHPVLVSRRGKAFPLNLFSQNWGGGIEGLGGDGGKGKCSGTTQRPATRTAHTSWQRIEFTTSQVSEASLTLQTNSLVLRGSYIPPTQEW